MNTNEYNILSTVTDTTYRDASIAGSFKIIPKITSEDTLTVTCMVVVNLLNRSEMKRESDKAADQLDKACNEEMKRIKKDFKLQSGRALKTKKALIDHSVELISLSGFSTKGTALVRRVYNFEVS
jgi:hypothetical protein